MRSLLRFHLGRHPCPRHPPRRVRRSGEVVSYRPELGHDQVDLECDQCGATWTGRPREACPYCAGLYTRAIAEQKRLLLRPELPDVDAARRDAAVAAWADRLAVAITAEIITTQEARTAYDREDNPTQKAQTHAA
jgi:hypothetical protein